VYIKNGIYNEYLEYVKAYQLRQYNDEKMTLLKNIKNEMNAIDHHLFYVIFHINHLLENHKIDKAQQILQQYKSVLIKQNMIIHTGNVIFDCLLSLKIIHNVKVKTCLFISQHEAYDHFMFIDFFNIAFGIVSICIKIRIIYT